MNYNSKDGSSAKWQVCDSLVFSASLFLFTQSLLVISHCHFAFVGTFILLLICPSSCLYYVLQSKSGSRRVLSIFMCRLFVIFVLAVI